MPRRTLLVPKPLLQQRHPHSPGSGRLPRLLLAPRLPSVAPGPSPRGLGASLVSASFQLSRPTSASPESLRIPLARAAVCSHRPSSPPRSSLLPAQPSSRISSSSGPSKRLPQGTPFSPPRGIRDKARLGVSGPVGAAPLGDLLDARRAAHGCRSVESPSVTRRQARKPRPAAVKGLTQAFLAPGSAPAGRPAPVWDQEGQPGDPFQKPFGPASLPHFLRPGPAAFLWDQEAHVCPSGHHQGLSGHPGFSPSPRHPHSGPAGLSHRKGGGSESRRWRRAWKDEGDGAAPSSSHAGRLEPKAGPQEQRGSHAGPLVPSAPGVSLGGSAPPQDHPWTWPDGQ
ncbi:translation initiation factor IF-2-like [Monodelphis domestica]|uniref:translation initiation factor IF-2-like n=1 Tax=Monodelphis domestica TaxID=13616 RepID=UPI0024E2272A|nr:translation initiation factor IF-2-like [Monodelphis domestica]